MTAQRAGLCPIICVGETIYERESGQTLQVIEEQLSGSLDPDLNEVAFIIAYEPVWSIGTGIIPSENNLTKNIKFIKDTLKRSKKFSKSKVLYGGSVNPKNIKELVQIKEINGFLIGGASLNAKKFIDIIKKSIN